MLSGEHCGPRDGRGSRVGVFTYLGFLEGSEQNNCRVVSVFVVVIIGHHKAIESPWLGLRRSQSLEWSGPTAAGRRLASRRGRALSVCRHWSACGLNTGTEQRPSSSVRLFFVIGCYHRVKPARRLRLPPLLLQLGLGQAVGELRLVLLSELLPPADESVVRGVAGVQGYSSAHKSTFC